MEIITYMVDGAIRHKDSTGQEGVIRPGDVQMMSAGRGIVHSEFNASGSERAHLLQIWIHPKQRGLDPVYQQRNFAEEFKNGAGQWVLLVSPRTEDSDVNSLTIQQDVQLWARKFEEGESLVKDLGKASGVWMQVVSGSVEWDGKTLSAGDGVGADVSQVLKLHANSKGEILLFVF
jgi:redox-sensitive bicupin YhaK (pirin superfamily)